MPLSLRRAARIAPAGAIAATLCFAPIRARAQDSTAAPKSNWLFAGTLGLPGTEEGPVVELFTAGIQFTQVEIGKIGWDIAIGTSPRVAAYGGVVGGARVGGVLPLELTPSVILLPSAGVSLVGGFGGGGGGGFAGLNVGLSGVVAPKDGVGFRTGVTVHHFPDAQATVWLAEIGVVMWM